MTRTAALCWWARPRRMPGFVGAALALGCGVGTGPRLTASWEGSREGSWSGRAEIAWCADAGRLEVTGVGLDRGVGFTIYPEDGLDGIPSGGEQVFPAFDPGLDSVRRPGAAGALRDFTERKVIGFQSDSGSLTLRRGKDGYQAGYTFRLRSLDAEDTIRLTGTAADLVPGPCPAPPPGTVPDSMGEVAP